MRLAKTYQLSLLSMFTLTLVARDSQPESPIYQRSAPDHVITFFIRPCFCTTEAELTIELDQELQDPAFLTRSHMKHLLKTMRSQGINAVYYGMTTHSDANGQIIFPRKQINNDMLVVITSKPQPILGMGVTVNRWTIDPKTPVAFYTYTQKIINKQLAWHVQKQEVPANRTIPPQALIIIVDPDEIIIHEGLSSTVQSPHIILPTIYTKKNINLDRDALRFLDINRYFAPTKKVVNYSQDRYAKMVQP